MRSFEKLSTYIYCPLLYYLKYELAANKLFDVRAQSTISLPGRAITSALQLYATKKYSPQEFPGIVKAVWQAWLEKGGADKNIPLQLEAYDGHYRRIMAQFLDGTVTKRGGEKYIEPRLSSRFKSMCSTAGISKLPENIENDLRKALNVTPGELPRLGPYLIANAYTESLLMAQRYHPPPPSEIVGAQAVGQIKLNEANIVDITADLVIADKKGVVVEVHDFEPLFYFRKNWPGKDLKVIAAGNFESSGENSPPVVKVVYRHFMSGSTIERRSLRKSRLIHAIGHARRGIEGSVYIPHFLSGVLDRCNACPVRDLCLSGEDPIEHVYPGALDWSDRAAAACKAVGIYDKENVKKLLQVINEKMVTINDIAISLDAK